MNQNKMARLLIVDFSVDSFFEISETITGVTQTSNRKTQ
jgi:hypothetical protein